MAERTATTTRAPWFRAVSPVNYAERTADSIGRLFDADDAFARLRLDGLVSLWQGSER